MAKRQGGGRYRRFRARILARDAYSPGSKPPARPVDNAGPPNVWLGEAFADLEVEGPALVIMHTGETRYVPAGRRG